jgi:hypothetical protein
MFKFLSLFRRSKDVQQNDSDYDFNETEGSVIDIQGEIGSQKPALIDHAFGEQHDPPPHVDRTQKEQTDQKGIGDVRAELRGMIENPFFKKGSLTEYEKEMLKEERDTDFVFNLTPAIPGQEVGKSRFSSINGGTIAARFPIEVWSQLTEEQKYLFGVNDGGTTLFYPKNAPRLEIPDTQDGQNNGPLMMDNLPQKIFSENERGAEDLTAEKLAEMIRNTPGDELVIYTGAGISKGGKNPVWDMPTLEKKVSVNEGSEAFLQALLNNPEALREAFNTFHQKVNTLNATPAHKAIKEILDAKPGATLMTQNGDRNHEASGVHPIHMAAVPEFYELLKKETDKTSLVVTAGLHADELSFLKWVTTKNPNVKIAAVDLKKPPKEYPSFLSKDSKNNYILQGDAQETLPKVAEVLKGEQTS